VRVAERLSTIAATATITSAAWILFGAVWLTHRAPAPETSAGQSLVATRAGAAPAKLAADEQAPLAPPAAPNAAGLVIPVTGVMADQLSDTFRDARGGGARLHEALDIMAPRGTPVIAAADGIVEKLFQSKNGGNTIYVRSPDRKTIHYYAHLDRYADGLHEGQEVRQGETLGAVGSTGDASPDGPHLHFEIMQTKPEAKWYEPAVDIDPYPLLTGKRP
jgi:murein DD-endopeptidase MepM/ murein hydrolase activator NlpD